MQNWRDEKNEFSILMLPPAFWLVTFFTLPLVVVWVYSFGNRGPLGETNLGFTLVNYVRAFELVHMAILWKTVWITIIVTALCFAFGFPMAMAISFAPGKWKLRLLMLVILPFWTNLLIRTYAWIAILRPRGILNGGLKWIHDTWYSLIGYGVEEIPKFVPWEILYNDKAVVIGLVYVHIPFMILPIYATMEKLDKSFLEASLDLGSSQMRTIFRVMMPLCMTGIVSGAMLVFVLTLGNFIVADVLGGTNSLMIGNQIARQFGAARDWPFGAALSFVILYATFILLWLRSIYAARLEQRDAKR
ncbi:hypothetical protein A9Q96_16755 [Rhodobacterales bacterium 52_120_T64]|nr:hypothetical protein A9Q96_16755 [Rhodobacterales bacterium 52_120_T64]